MSNPERRVVRALAAATTERLVRQVRLSLTRMRDALLSGEDSGLQNTWEEYVVQVQGQHSIYFDTYVLVLQEIVEGMCKRCMKHELEAIWLQTDAGFDWLWEEDRVDDVPPVLMEDVERYITDRVTQVAMDWTNRRIENHLASCFPD